MSGSRVLVVDDNADSAIMVATYLGMFGHAVEVAHEGQTALERAATFVPEVVILDLRLPDMHGFELVGRLRAMPGLEAATLIVLSGLGDEETKRQAHACGIQRFFVKPVDLGALEAELAARA